MATQKMSYESAIKQLKWMRDTRIKADDFNALNKAIKALEVLAELSRKYEPHELVCVGDVLRGDSK